MLMLYRFQNVDLENVSVKEDVNTNAWDVAELTWTTAELTWDIVNESTGTVVWIANPASVYCEDQGWTVNIVEDEEWNQSWICKLADWTEVDEWEYFRENNKSEEESWEATWTGNVKTE